jgi:hypothetical protein
MKTQFYSYFLASALISSLFFSSTLSAQRSRHDRHDHYDRYDRRNYSYYPQRNSYYGRPYVSVRFGSYDYRYQNGYFYRPYGSGLRLVFPPFGVRISTLPYGYRSFYMGANPYYYYNGIYYQPYGREYEVVAPPLGAVVYDLPSGAKVKVINGEKYYEVNGTYYQEDMDENNRLSYTVVGTDGVLNTDDAIASTDPAIGDRIDKLPADSKPVVIQGEKLFSTSSGLYYKEVIEGNKVHYELVGK